MKFLCIMVNIVFLISGAGLWIQEYLWRDLFYEFTETVYILGILAVPILNLIFFFRKKSEASLLELYFRCKKLELKNKIDQLNK